MHLRRRRRYRYYCCCCGHLVRESYCYCYRRRRCCSRPHLS